MVEGSVSEEAPSASSFLVVLGVTQAVEPQGSNEGSGDRLCADVGLRCGVRMVDVEGDG